MGRGKGRLIKRGNSLIVDFYFKGVRYRPSLRGLSSSKKAHIKTGEDILTRIQADIITDKFNFAAYFPDHPKAKLFRKGSDIQIKEKLYSYLEAKRRTIESSTFSHYQSNVEYHLIPHFGDIYLPDLTSAMVREWRDSLPVSNKTANDIMIHLRAIYDQAYSDDLIDDNPLARIKNLPRTNPEPDPFSREEMWQILRHCEGQLHNVLKFAFYTGTRPEEYIALKWSDINMKAETAHIRTVTTKHGTKDRPKTDSSIRNIDLHQPATEAIKAQLQYTSKEAQIFLNPHTNKPWPDSSNIRDQWKTVLKHAGVRYRKPYNTRHTYASMMLSSNINPMYVANQMGHKDWGMIRKVYGRWISDVDTSIQHKIQHLWPQNGHKVTIND